jgi:hypothetical protein
MSMGCNWRRWREECCNLCWVGSRPIPLATSTNRTLEGQLTRPGLTRIDITAGCQQAFSPRA